MKYKYKPVVASFPSKEHPEIPPDLKVTCLLEPGTLKDSPNCPVIAWNEYIYWAYSYTDNRVGMCIVAYEENGKFVKRWDKTGARYVYKITSDESTETITFWGQSDQKIVVSWSELYLMMPPVEGKIPANVHPAIPTGLKVTCMQSPDKLEPSPTCPVLEWNGYTYWAYSYIDNRYAMNIVAYDEKGNVVRQWEKSGARYVYRITVDVAVQTVTFWGQSDKTIVMKWAELAIE